MMKYASLALVFVFGAALFGSVASAQLLDAEGSVNVTGSAASEQTTTDTAVDASVDTTTSAEDDMDADSGSSVQLNIERSALDVNTNYTVSTADSVRSSSSLESYASATVRADERLESIEVADGRLDMTYRKKAKFLWLIPASMTVNVSVTEASEVAVRYPWYAFLMQADESRADLEARLAAEINSINASAAASADAEVSGEARSTGVQADSEIRRWARIIESTYVVVSGSTYVDANASTDS